MTVFTPSSRTMQPMAKFLPKDAMNIFCEAASTEESGGASHNECVLAGWEAVKAAGWQKPAIGKKWIKKDSPTSGDVHVDGVIGSKKPKAKDKSAEEIMAGCTKIDLASIEMPVAKNDEEDEIDFEITTEVLKVEDSLGLVFGFAIVCKKDGVDYYDTQGDHIPEDAMVKAGMEFMLNSRVAKDMHAGDAIGEGIVFAFPMTSEIAKSLDFDTKGNTGFLIAMKPSAEVLGKFKSGDYTGFSIGGRRLQDEEVA